MWSMVSKAADRSKKGKGSDRTLGHVKKNIIYILRRALSCITLKVCFFLSHKYLNSLISCHEMNVEAWIVGFINTTTIIINTLM